MLISCAGRDAGLTGKTAHGLRKARAVILAVGGWPPHRIGVWTGYESLLDVAHYIPSANKRAMASANRSAN